MASKITRFLLKHFGSTGNVAEFGKIGSDTAGSPVNTKDPDTMQSLAGFLSGLFALTNSGVEAPRLEDLNSLFYLVMRQLVYMAQSGVPEWIATEDYYTNSLARVGSRVYVSKTGVDGAANTGNNPTTDTTNWIDFLDASRLTGTIPLANIPATLTGKTADNATHAVDATKLTTARTIGGVSFDGSANINLPGVNTAGNQNTSGKATTAGYADTAGSAPANGGTADLAYSLQKYNPGTFVQVGGYLDINIFNNALSFTFVSSPMAVPVNHYFVGLFH